MAFDLVRSAASNRDLDLIFDHLVEAYLSFGDARQEAFDRASARLQAIDDDLKALVHAPFQGTLLPNISPDLRHVTKNRAIITFKVDEVKNQVQILAIFFGGQDHQRHMLARLGERQGDDA
ncbi:type II toxin-antitoxin system RelE/ParE family toxin [Agrobacterium vitis]|uniref:type II toxin-antitoxin system RelE/ParE family toxin n=1 Tax=Agrobacterium vitis TaxID=373 RepID=UPI001F2662BE|nr:type II toxin-antitoxin system RelE/ParE family toxin [Agrobacterium vitis]